MQRNKVGTLPHITYKNTEWIKDLNRIAKTKTLRKYRCKFYDLELAMVS
jgi:hypothetical protein